MTTACDRITLLFSLLGGAEEASCSFATAPTLTPTQDEMEALALAASTIFAAQAWALMKGYYSNTTSFIGAEARSFDSENKLVAAGQSILATPVAGASATATMPPNCAIVVSLRTGAPGPRGRGRMYLPAPVSTQVTSTGRMDPTMTTVIADEMRDFFNAWNSDPITFPVGVASQVGGYVQTVNQIRVGNVFDTQRRRRDNLPEAYLVRAIT